jgi:drug/metabolite transporter (DMT)-like permease
MLGQCLVQVMLKFSMLFGALAVDMILEKKSPRRSHVLGVGVVLLGVIAIAFGGSTLSETPTTFAVVMGMSAALASGVGYVLSARFTVPSGGADLSSTAFVSFLAIASMESVALGLSVTEGTGFYIQGKDALLWVFVVSQGLLYTRSFQMLPSQIGYTATFTFCLAAQLLTAALFDHTKSISSQIIGLTLVFCGAALSELWSG